MATMNAPATERRHIPERRTAMSITGTTTLSSLDWLAMILMIIGGINWGLIGAFDVNLLTSLFGVGTPLTRLVYAVVGLAALYGVYMLTKLSQR
jgi:uncharacterized membrane protein YuzA (DUF378 family)